MGPSKARSCLSRTQSASSFSVWLCGSPPKVSPGDMRPFIAVLRSSFFLCAVLGGVFFWRPGEAYFHRIEKTALRVGVENSTSFRRLPTGAALAQRRASGQQQGSSADSPAPPVLLLDVDGVLNTYTTGSARLEEALLLNLKKVLESTGAQLVISSAWRLHPDDHMVLLGKKSKEVIGIDLNERKVGQTPALPNCKNTECRAKEIEAWAAASKPQGSWVAVDDMDLVEQDPHPDGFDWAAHFVKTDPKQGLTSAKAAELEALLVGKPSPPPSSAQRRAAPFFLQILRAVLFFAPVWATNDGLA